MAAGETAISDGEIDALNESLKRLNEEAGRNSRNDVICFESNTNKSVRQTQRKRKKSVDVETQTPKKRCRQPDDRPKKRAEDVREVTDGLIQQLDSKLERLLEEKAMKNNLSVTNVKSILKNIICSPEVTDIFLNSLGDGRLLYEPKLTRSKAKQLLDTPPKTAKRITSETQILMEDDLPDDSSDDEYRPNYDEEDPHSDDESFVSSHASDIGSPAHSHQESDVFRKPLPISGSSAEEGLIVNRTRSKLPLTDTPLETLELAFIPPDITTDMYDFDCDDEGWKNFLVELQYPQPSLPQDDEEADPDFNFLEDEEELDREELRVDRAVRISQKEVKSLLAELFEDEDLDISSENEAETVGHNSSTDQSNPVPPVAEREFTREPTPSAENESPVALHKKPTGVVYPIQVNPETVKLTVSFPTLDTSPITIESPVEKPCEGPTYSSAELLPPQARLILEDQLRKHVQLLTQVHMITAQQRELSRAAAECREMLSDLDRNTGHLNVANLSEALELTRTWEAYLQRNPASTSKPSALTKVHDKCGTRRRKLKGPHPQMIQMMAVSNVFLYPRLLPRLALFDTREAGRKASVHEEQLLAMGLEEFRPFVESLLTENRKQALDKACSMMISYYMLPQWNSRQIYRRICRLRIEKKDNPVKYFLRNGTAPPVQTKIWPFNPLKMVPLKDRDPQALPWTWRNAIHGPQLKKGRPRTIPSKPIESSKKPPRPDPPPRARTVYNLRPAVRFRLPDPDEGFSSSGEELDEEELRRLLPGEEFQRTGYEGAEPPQTGQKRAVSGKPRRGRKPRTVLPEKESSQKQTPADLVPAPKTSAKRGRPRKKVTRRSRGRNTEEPAGEVPPVSEPAEDRQSTPLPSGGVKRYVLLSQICTDSAEVLHVWGPPGGTVRTASDSQTSGGGGGTQGGGQGAREEGGASSQGEQVLTGEGGASMEGGGAGGGDENDDGDKRRDPSDKADDRAAAAEEEQEEEESDNQATAAGAGTSGLVAKARSPTHRHIRNQRLAKRVLQSWLADEGQSANSDFGYAQAYFQKVRQVLTPANLETFCRLLSELEQNPQAAALIYEQIKELFAEHVDLAEEFVIFFTAEQAALCGKQFLHFLLVRLRDFFTRVKIYLKDSPQQLKRITKTLENLTDSCDSSVQDIKTAILPLLKGNAFLTNQFLQLFPRDVSFDSLASDFEETRLDSAPCDDFEHIRLTRDRDPGSKARRSSAKSQVSKGKNKGKSWKK